MGKRLILVLLSAVLLVSQATAESLRPRQLAPGVHVFIGAADEARPGNGGRIGNSGVIIGTQGCLIVGTGTSDAQGNALLAAVARLTDKPVLLAINAYAAPHHVLGNTAFARKGIPVLAHRHVDAYMATHCDECLRNLAESLGTPPLEGTLPMRPTQLADGTTSIDLGGRIVDLIWYKNGPRPGTLAVFDRNSHVLFAGALATFDVVPDARDADIDGWLAHLRDLSRLRPRTIVPGQGRPGNATRLNEVASYLASLQRGTSAAYDSGLSIASAPSSLDLPRFKSWALYDSRHPRNVHFEYLRCEARDLGISPEGATRAPDRTD